MFITRETCIDMPYWLLSQINTTGSFQTEAIFNDSWNSPSFEAPSPK